VAESNKIQVVVSAANDTLGRISYEKIDYQILALDLEEKLERHLSIEIDRFEAKKILLCFKRVEGSTLHYFIFPDKTFSLEVPDRKELLASSVWEDAGEAYDNWDKMR
jgi:hypothetical protein